MEHFLPSYASTHAAVRIHSVVKHSSPRYPQNTCSFPATTCRCPNATPRRAGGPEPTPPGRCGATPSSISPPSRRPTPPPRGRPEKYKYIETGEFSIKILAARTGQRMLTRQFERCCDEDLSRQVGEGRQQNTIYHQCPWRKYCTPCAFVREGVKGSRSCTLVRCAVLG